MTILQEISTHKAVVNDGMIDIIQKGISIPIGYEYPDGSVEEEGFFTPDEKLYSILRMHEDDLFAIFERLEEDNRINLAEANAEFGNL